MSLSLVAALVFAVVLIAACTDSDTPADPDQRLVAAPIVEVAIVPPDVSSGRYALRVVSALPDGCHTYHDAAVTRRDAVVTVTVRNAVPARENLACTQIYGTVTHTLDLGDGFAAGATYEVVVNGTATRFTAR